MNNTPQKSRGIACLLLVVALFSWLVLRVSISLKPGMGALLAPGR